MKKIQTEGIELYLRDEKDWGFWQNGFYEPEETKLVQSIIKPEWNCIDIGANIGYFTILMAKQCIKVSAYEPEPSNFDMLINNILLNKIQNIFPHRTAVSDKTGMKKLYLSDINNGMHRLYKSKHATFGTTEVDTVRLDDIDNPKIDFIKMDVEGAELGALIGMKKLLERDHPILMMEFHPMSIREYGARPEKVCEFLKLLGYQISLIPNMEQISCEDLVKQTSDQSGGRNVLCV